MAKRKKKTAPRPMRKNTTLEKRNVERVAVSLGVLLGVLYTLKVIALVLAPEATLNFFTTLLQGTVTLNQPVIDLSSYFVGLVEAVAIGVLIGIVYGKINNMLKTS